VMLAVLDGIDLDAVSGYQPYWAVRAHLLQRLGKTSEAANAFDRAIGLAEDPTSQRQRVCVFGLPFRSRVVGDCRKTLPSRDLIHFVMGPTSKFRP
jgi:hypothetical protein